MRNYALCLLSIAVFIASTISPGALAADSKQSSPKGSHGEITKEQRQKMAEMHQKMADCLKSDKPISECRSEMMKECHEKMGAEGCPMMGHGMGEAHMHKGKSMSSKESAESSESDEHSEHH